MWLHRSLSSCQQLRSFGTLPRHKAVKHQGFSSCDLICFVKSDDRNRFLQNKKTRRADLPITCFSFALSHFLEACLKAHLVVCMSNCSSTCLEVPPKSEQGSRRCDVTTWQEMNEDLACASFAVKLSLPPTLLPADTPCCSGTCSMFPARWMETRTRQSLAAEPIPCRLMMDSDIMISQSLHVSVCIYDGLSKHILKAGLSPPGHV